MRAALIFGVTGVAFFVFWALARPSYEQTDAMTEWPDVLWFSATLLTLAVALPTFGRMVGGPQVIRAATVAGTGVGLSSVANIFEDGFRISEFFFLFILGTLILNVTLLALTLVVARRLAGPNILLALIPLGTLVGFVLFVVVGGPVMLITWLAAAAVAIRRQTPIAAAPTSS